MRRRSGGKPKTHGAFTSKLRRPATEEHPVSVQSVEPENPRHTGGSKPTQREILEHNVSEGQLKEHPETVAGQHATGSFTDKKRHAS